MIEVLVFSVALIAFVLLTAWLGSEGETSGKAGDSVGTGSSTGGGDGA